MSTSATALKVFVSYAHEDESHRQALGKHLRALEREGLIEIWHDRMITGGREWKGAIDEALKSSNIILLLISADFLDSDYCNDVELSEAIRMHDAQLVRVVPLILRSCDWKHSLLARFNALPPDGQPIVEAEYPDQRFSMVATGLRQVVEELRGTYGSASGEQPLAATSHPAQQEPIRPTRTLTIGKLSLFGVLELGPFDLPWPPRVGLKSILTGVLVLILTAAGLYFFAVRGPMGEAQEDLRMARYDSAQATLDAVPKWLAWWPQIKRMRVKAELGTRFYKKGQDWEVLGKELRRQRAEHSQDADLMVLEAMYWIRWQDYDQARPLLKAAVKVAPGNAEAWFQLGLDRDMAGDLEAAATNYRQAVDAAPESPQYRNNLARTLLESHRPEEAIREYRQVSQYPLARVEEALAHWAIGEWRAARDAQRDALNMLADPEIQARVGTRRAWIFNLWALGKGVRLASLNDKRCYAQLGEAASLRLAGETQAAFPPAECADPPVEIEELVADDLCRFVDGPQPSFAGQAGRLREALHRPNACPTPPPNPRPTEKGQTI